MLLQNVVYLALFTRLVYAATAVATSTILEKQRAYSRVNNDVPLIDTDTALE